MCSGLSTDLQFNELHSAEDHCEQAARPWLYAGLGLVALLILPLQYLIMSIFKAYADEIKDGEVEYQQLPGEDQDNAINNMA